eukprot:TRINITY_DN2516_c0_g1_i3.p1 TRINITY_DN2516_c0_g1~~TRINITY_DN2516_c0_g1_i3.p1  ORF type:complete len:449 (+),score=92.02 TRINITY_DN2516_c0_g1_i3:74-1420(+)
MVRSSSSTRRSSADDPEGGGDSMWRCAFMSACVALVGIAVFVALRPQRHPPAPRAAEPARQLADRHALRRTADEVRELRQRVGQLEQDAERARSLHGETAAAVRELQDRLSGAPPRTAPAAVAAAALPPPPQTPRPPPAPLPSTGSRPRVLLLQYVCFGRRGEPNCAQSDLWRLVPEQLTHGPDHLPPPWQPPAPLPCVQPRDGPPPPPVSLSAATRRRLLEASGPREPPFYSVSTANKAAYCLRHGYGMRIAGAEAYSNATDRARAWGVIRAIMIAVTEGWDWVLYIDQDTLITEGSIAVHELGQRVPPHRHMVITRDLNGYNSGVLMFRGTDEALGLLKKFWKKGGSPGFPAFHPWTFQLGIMHVLDQDQSARSITQVLPQRALNSYPPWTPGLGHHDTSAKWHSGDFNVHFAGCSDQTGRDCQRELLQFIPKVRGLGCDGKVQQP